MNLNKLLKEVKATQISVGDIFTLGGDLGEFKKGEKVEVQDKGTYGADIKISLSNNQGTTDEFYIDKNDDFEELLT